MRTSPGNLTLAAAAALTVALASAACGPNAAEIRRAHDAHYRGPTAALVDGAAAALTAEHYAIDGADRDAGRVVSRVKVFSATGDLESEIGRASCRERAEGWEGDGRVRTKSGL